MTTTLTPLPVFQWINSQGQPLVGGQLFSYVAGTSTFQPTYTDSTGTVANTNPVILDASGSAPIWLASANYKLVLKDPLGNVLWTVDNINATQGSFLSSQGGTLYNPGNQTGLIINADTGFQSTITFQVGGINSFLLSSNTTGQLNLWSWNGSSYVLNQQISGTLTNFLGASYVFGSNTTASPTVAINGAAATQRLLFWSTASSPRWNAGTDASAESGSNAGSNFTIGAWSDSGIFLGQAAICNRSTQAWTFPVSISSPSITDTSDRRKKNIKHDISLDEAWSWIEKLDPVHFSWKSSGRDDIGLIAQEVEKILPEIISEDANGVLGIAYQKLVCPLIVLIKEQQRRLEELEAKVK